MGRGDGAPRHSLSRLIHVTGSSENLLFPNGRVRERFRGRRVKFRVIRFSLGGVRLFVYYLMLIYMSCHLPVHK